MWDDDDERPPAPLPAHERTWRHPSELGQARWQASEPPLAVGRGLSVATTCIGVGLAVGLLWLMVPRSSHRPSFSQAPTLTISTVGSVRISSPTFEPMSTVTEPSPSTLRAAPLSTTPPTAATQTTTRATTVIVPASVTEQSPTTTTTITNSEVIDPALASLEDAPPVEGQRPEEVLAFAMTEGRFLVTTSAAVDGRQAVKIMMPSGDNLVGAVIADDPTTGTAVIALVDAPAESMMLPTFDLATSAEQAIVVGMMKGPMTASEEAVGSLRVDEDGGLVFDTEIEPYEAAALVTETGEMVGLCTRGTKTATSTEGSYEFHVIAASDLWAMLELTLANPSEPWLGVEVSEDQGNDAVTITAVKEHSPAAANKLQRGDQITAIDGRAVASELDVATILKAHNAGDTVTLRVRQVAAEQPIDLTLTLSLRPPGF